MYIHPNLGSRHNSSQASSFVASSYSIPSLLEPVSFDSVRTPNPIAVREAFESLRVDFSRRSSNTAITAESYTSPLFLGLHRVLHSTAPNPVAEATLRMQSALPTSATITTNNAHSDTMRTFGAIICRDCLYLEFPGCDIHGMLYCERVISEVEDSGQDPSRGQNSDTTTSGLERQHMHSNQQHAKCAKCAAATNNVRPFRDGCRRCKGTTVIHMWNTSQQELAKAFEAFPPQLEEIHHTVLVCEFCQSVIFPRALDQLTQRTDQHVLTIMGSGKPLQMSNYQLSMPHVDGCPRKGMPMQGSAIHLPKGELKFAYDRIQDCPEPHSIRAEIQYQKRGVEVVTTQNHLQQMYLRLFRSLLLSADPAGPNIIEPLRKIRDLLEMLQPLSLFGNWAPPKRSERKDVEPIRASASSEATSMHSASKVFDADGWWESKQYEEPVKEAGLRMEEWILFQFDGLNIVTFVDLEWHKGLVPSKLIIETSIDECAYKSASVLTELHQSTQIAFSQGQATKSVRISMYGHEGEVRQFGIKSVKFYTAIEDHLYSAPDILLRDIESWLSEAAKSHDNAVREIALDAFQKLVLASGSLCGLIKLGSSLLSRNAILSSGDKSSQQCWNEVDAMSSNCQIRAHQFLVDISSQLLQHMLKNEEECANTDSHAAQELLRRSRSPSNHKDEVPTRWAELLKERNDGGLGMPWIMAIADPTFGKCISQRSQLALVLFFLVREVSLWQMKRMQSGECLIDREGSKRWHNLEEPFSIEVRSEVFDLLDRLLHDLLDGTRINQGRNAADSGGAFLSTLLNGSFSKLEASILAKTTNETEKSYPIFHLSSDELCVAILQILCSNLRRLVLSHVDPAEVGLRSTQISMEADVASSTRSDAIAMTLEQLIALGTKRSDQYFAISLEAAAAIDVGMEVFYPSPYHRTRLLTSRMGKGATLEVQVRWPVQDRDQEDPRFERFLLALQLECGKHGLTHAIRGSWQFYLHLVIQLSPTQNTRQVLECQFASCIQRAGFSSWQVAAGAQEISISLQRHLHWDRMQKMSQDSGAAWIRVYPSDVATYDEVLSDVESFVCHHEERKDVAFSKMSPSNASTAP